MLYQGLKVHIDEAVNRSLEITRQFQEKRHQEWILRPEQLPFNKKQRVGVKEAEKRLSQVKGPPPAIPTNVQPHVASSVVRNRRYQEKEVADTHPRYDVSDEHQPSATSDYRTDSWYV